MRVAFASRHQTNQVWDAAITIEDLLANSLPTHLLKATSLGTEITPSVGHRLAECVDESASGQSGGQEPKGLAEGSVGDAGLAYDRAALRVHPLESWSPTRSRCPSTIAPAGPARASTAARPRAASGSGPSGQVNRTTNSAGVRRRWRRLDPLEDYSATHGVDNGVDNVGGSSVRWDQTTEHDGGGRGEPKMVVVAQFGMSRKRCTGG
jgi:hypothetical protein